MVEGNFPNVRALDVDLIVLPEVDSTHRYLADHPGQSDRTTVVVTDNQVAGRGRMGRMWHTGPGQGLAVSIQLARTDIPSPMSTKWLQWLALVVGASLAETISPLLSGPVSVKWPNDVLVSGKKVAGVLGEITPRGDVLVGVGINLSYAEADLPTPESTSLNLHGASLSGLADRVIAGLLSNVLRTLPRIVLTVDEPTRSWVTSWLGTIGQRVRVSQAAGHVVVGVATGLDEDGSLLVVPEGGSSPVVISVGDIEHLRHWPSGTN